MITPLKLRSLDITSIFQVDRWNRPVLYDRKRKKFVVEFKLHKLLGWSFILFMRNILSTFPAIFITESIIHGNPKITMIEHAIWINSAIAVMFFNCSDLILLIHRETFAASFNILRALELNMRRRNISNQIQDK